MVLGQPIHLVQLTDTHLFAEETQTLLGIPTAESLAQVLQSVRDLDPQPTHLLLTGDLSQDESIASYQKLAELIQPLGLPTFWLPGNHDHLDRIVQTFVHPPFRSDKSLRLGDWRLLLLNSQILGKVAGRLSLESLEWLDLELSQDPQTPTLISLHHPPFSLDTEWLDNSALLNPEDFFAVCDRHPQIKLILFGHIHQEFEATRNDVTYLGCPSTCIQFARGSDTFALDEQKPGFRCLSLYADGSWNSHVQRVSYDRAIDLSYQGSGY